MSAERVAEVREQIERIDAEVAALIELRREASRELHSLTVGAILRRQRTEHAERKLERVRSMDSASVAASAARTASRLPREANPVPFSERAERDA